VTINIFDQIQGFLNFATFISLKRKGQETAKETLCCQQSQLKQNSEKPKDLQRLPLIKVELNP